MDNFLKKRIEEYEKEIKKTPQIILQPSFEKITEISSLKQVKINIPSLNLHNLDGELLKTSGIYLLTVGIFAHKSDETYDVEIIFDGFVFPVKEIHFYHGETTLTRNENDPMFSGEMKFHTVIREIVSSQFETQPAYYRSVINAPKADLDSYVHCRGYRDETKIYSGGQVTLEVGKVKLVLTRATYDKEYYLIIDASEKINFQLFAEASHSVMIGYGFLSGYFFQQEVYYLKSDSIEFKAISDISYLQLRPSILSYGTANPIHSNANGYTRDENIIKRVGRKLPVFTAELFSKLSSKILQESDYATLILLIIESHKASLVLQPAGYSVALEKITNIIAAENKGLKPIPDKILAKSFTAEITAILDKFKVQIQNAGNQDSITILKKNIDKLNNPTNQDKLTKPFKIYDIVLSSEDLKAIANRNNFLHGRPLEIDDHKTSIETYVISLRLNKIVCKLILKHLGFSGFIINHLKHNENLLPFPLNEHLFEPI